MNNKIQNIINNPITHVPAWTVALFDPTKGELPRHQPDEEKMIDYVEAISAAGAPGVLFAASTGWGHARNFAEHRHTLKISSQADIGNTVKQALIRIEDPLEENIQLIKDLKEWGYGIIWTRRGSNLSLGVSDELVADHMFSLVKAAIDKEMPVGLYSISTVDGAPLTAGASKILLNKLGSDLSKYVVAIKITEPEFETSTRHYLNEPAFSGKKIVQGWDAFYAQALKEGKRTDGSNHCGATSGAAACMVYAYKAMYEATLNNDWEKLTKIQEVVSLVFLSMQGEDKTKFPDLQIAKWVMGLGHPLTEKRGKKDAEKLLQVLHKLSSNDQAVPYLNLILDSLMIMNNKGYYSPLQADLEKIKSSII